MAKKQRKTVSSPRRRFTQEFKQQSVQMLLDGYCHLPPHLGAWCKGKLGNNLAYVSFFRNALHRASGIAVNAGFWAMNRALWANVMLASMGIRA
jgi:hypothetical protein